LKEAEKLTKHRLLQDEIHRIWGTTVVIFNIYWSFKHGQIDLLKKLPKEVCCSFVEIQKTILLGLLAINIKESVDTLELVIDCLIVLYVCFRDFILSYTLYFCH